MGALKLTVQEIEELQKLVDKTKIKRDFRIITNCDNFCQQACGGNCTGGCRGGQKR